MSGSSIRTQAPTHRGRLLTVGTLAGLAGGAIEIGWIALYQHLTGHAAAAVARGVTQSVLPGLASAPDAVLLGLAIHMALAVALGVVIAIAVPRVLPRIAGTPLEPVAVVAALVGVWAVNFFVVLPVINPAFVTLVPYGASLVSKVLFGFAAAFVFWGARWSSNTRRQ